MRSNGSAARAWEVEHSAKLPQLRKLWRDGVPTRQIARELQMSISTVWLVTKRLEMPRRARPPGLRNG